MEQKKYETATWRKFKKFDVTADVDSKNTLVYNLHYFLVVFSFIKLYTFDIHLHTVAILAGRLSERRLSFISRRVDSALLCFCTFVSVACYHFPVKCLCCTLMLNSVLGCDALLREFCTVRFSVQIVLYKMKQGKICTKLNYCVIGQYFIWSGYSGWKIDPCL